MTTKRIFMGALGAATLALSLAPGASASNVRAGTNSVAYYAAQGEVNRVTIGYSNGAYVVTDLYATLQAQSGCTRVSVHVARCPGQPNAQITAYGDDRNDILDIDAGGGSYTIAGGAGDDLVLGTAGNDIISGGPGNDVINGRGGDDFIGGNEGADRMSGGPGIQDVVSYAERTVPVRADLEGGADDGVAGEGDQIDPDVENLIGGQANDTLIGNASVNRLDGIRGNDQLWGRAASDELVGNRGNDFLRGEDGNDKLDGDGNAPDGAGRDVLVGGPGGDQLLGGPLNDVAYGEAGDDTLRGGDGNDVMLGGTEMDVLYGEKGDDDLQGDPGNDLLLGAQGNDTLEGGIGQDALLGGSGTDVATYAIRWDPVRVSLDDFANDGLNGERDNVRTDVERIVGGHAADTLVGNAASQVIWGGDGKDVIEGGGSRDFLYGEGDDDLLRTRDGVKDAVDCGLGRDTIVMGRDTEAPMLGCEIRDHREF
jgi:Ca2+-binding RTX toxin-like protein